MLCKVLTSTFNLHMSSSVLQNYHSMVIANKICACWKSDINTTGATSETGTTYRFGISEFTSGLQCGSRCSIFSFLSSVLEIIVCPYSVWPLSCLSFDSDNLFSFSIFKHFAAGIIFQLPIEQIFQVSMICNRYF